MGTRHIFTTLRAALQSRSLDLADLVPTTTLRPALDGCITGFILGATFLFTAPRLGPLRSGISLPQKLIPSHPGGIADISTGPASAHIRRKPPGTSNHNTAASSAGQRALRPKQGYVDAVTVVRLSMPASRSTKW